VLLLLKLLAEGVDLVLGRLARVLFVEVEDGVAGAGWTVGPYLIYEVVSDGDENGGLGLESLVDRLSVGCGEKR
jgi:hypothetical protein